MNMIAGIRLYLIGLEQVVFSELFLELLFGLWTRIRSLLKAAYNLINVAYMKLSREMEYHADLVAVSVGGNNSLVNALKKTEFSSFAYDLYNRFFRLPLRIMEKRVKTFMQTIPLHSLF